MKERDCILKRFLDPEDRLLAAHLLDKLDWMQKHSCMACSKFLTPHEAAVAQQVVECTGFPNHIMTGGVPQAERKVLLFLPDYLLAEDLTEEELPFGAVHADWGRGNLATHRDVLGSLMAIGIKRETLGDLLVDDKGCDVIVIKDCLPFLLSSWESAGRVRFHPQQVPLSSLTVPISDGEEVRDTVASLRLDAVIGSGFSMSRGKAADLIRSGRVTLNGKECTKTDAQLEQGDAISARGFGKLVIKEAGELSRKGRIWIVMEKFG